MGSLLDFALLQLLCLLKSEQNRSERYGRLFIGMQHQDRPSLSRRTGDRFPLVESAPHPARFDLTLLRASLISWLLPSIVCPQDAQNDIPARPQGTRRPKRTLGVRCRETGD